MLYNQYIGKKVPVMRSGLKILKQKPISCITLIHSDHESFIEQNYKIYLKKSSAVQKSRIVPYHLIRNLHRRWSGSIVEHAAYPIFLSWTLELKVRRQWTHCKKDNYKERMGALTARNCV